MGHRLSDGACLRWLGERGSAVRPRASHKGISLLRLPTQALNCAKRKTGLGHDRQHTLLGWNGRSGLPERTYRARAMNGPLWPILLKHSLK